jgi:simple sugar transport system permease protein
MIDLRAGRIPGWLSVVLSIAVAIVLMSLALALAGAPVLATFDALYRGSVGTWENQADVLVATIATIGVSAGLLVTFRAGQWNIGAEGQVAIGSIAATYASRWLWASDALMAVPLMLLIGALAGAVWGLLAGLLKTKGKVSEIFAGLGLNFVAQAATIYFIFGPWRQARSATASGTDLMPEAIWMPTVGETRLSVYAIVGALVVLVVIGLALGSTRWGLELKAVGKNPRAAFVLGVPTERVLLSAYAVCGACCGLVGAYIMAGIHHRLITGISAGYGFLGILIVLLAGVRALWVLPIALFFAAISVGSTGLQLELRLDSAVGGILQAGLVLALLFVQGALDRRRAPRATPDDKR